MNEFAEWMWKIYIKKYSRESCGWRHVMGWMSWDFTIFCWISVDEDLWNNYGNLVLRWIWDGIVKNWGKCVIFCHNRYSLPSNMLHISIKFYITFSKLFYSIITASWTTNYSISHFIKLSKHLYDLMTQ
jgi:hypothetical protein